MKVKVFLGFNKERREVADKVQNLNAVKEDQKTRAESARKDKENPKQTVEERKKSAAERKKSAEKSKEKPINERGT